MTEEPPDAFLSLLHLARAPGAVWCTFEDASVDVVGVNNLEAVVLHSSYGDGH